MNGGTNRQGSTKFHNQQCLLFPDQFQPLSLKAFGLPLVLQHRPRVFARLERA